MAQRPPVDAKVKSPPLPAKREAPSPPRPRVDARAESPSPTDDSEGPVPLLKSLTKRQPEHNSDDDVFNNWIALFLPLARSFLARVHLNIPLEGDAYHQAYMPSFPRWLVVRQIRGEVFDLLDRSEEWCDAIERDEIKCHPEIQIGVVWFRNTVRALADRWGWERVGENNEVAADASEVIGTDVATERVQHVLTVGREHLDALSHAVRRIEDQLEKPKETNSLGRLIASQIPPGEDRLTHKLEHVHDGIDPVVLELHGVERVTDFERALLTAHRRLGNARHKGDRIAELAGYPVNSRLYAALSSLVKRGYLESSKKGYLRGPKFSVLTDNDSH